MKTVTFTSKSEKKIELLMQVAKEMGVEAKTYAELTDEEMALPGPKVSKTQLEEWLAKDDGKGYEIDEAFKIIKSNISKKRKKKNGG
jgi:hypothetical protein